MTSKMLVNLDGDKSLCDHVIDHWWSLADPRTKNWILIDSPVPVAVILSIYYSFVLLGYRLMRSQKPFDLRRPLIAYNISMTFLNFIIAYKLIANALKLNYNFTCEPSQAAAVEDKEVSDQLVN